ncbi:hypothetical protein THRCLA_02177 [Thraustotheca clavata]|uniref:VWFA domain-containing protein n=1 Tax=Thraustotheca clavata TaxID=74557 RepID=A0A1W0A612_9STRA|nr:hypothetical protein THRCLA_02177 [Thraustotheca clavata]
MTSITVSSAPEYGQVCADDTSTLFVNCHLQAPNCDDDQRKPIDLVVVLDRSGSMSGKKLSLCKKTMDFLAQQLSVHDRVALVTYDSDVTTDLRLTKMTPEGKRKFDKHVKAIQGGSCTNLSGGLMAGIQEIQQSDRIDGGEPNPVQSVLLLTDGLANEGVKSRDGIVNLVEGTLGTNISLFTFGYGSDHDNQLLRQLSDLGRGSYYFIQNVDSVTSAFADCLGGLLSVVAQSIKVSCISVSQNVIIKQIKTKRPMNVVTPGQYYEIEMGDLYAEEVRDILVQVEVQQSSVVDSQQLVQFIVRYANVLTSTLESKSTGVAISRPQKVTDKSINVMVAKQKHRIEAAETIELAQGLANRGQLSEGQAMITRFIKTLKSEFNAFNLDSRSNQEKELLDGLYDCIRGMTNQRTYQERGQYRMTSHVQSHQGQRSNDAEISFNSLATTASTSTYRNSRKTQMMSTASTFHY